jgi:hypothetical protein
MSCSTRTAGSARLGAGTRDRNLSGWNILQRPTAFRKRHGGDVLRLAAASRSKAEMATISPLVPDNDTNDAHTIGRKGTRGAVVEIIT